MCLTSLKPARLVPQALGELCVLVRLEPFKTIFTTIDVVLLSYSHGDVVVLTLLINEFKVYRMIAWKLC